MLHTPIVAGKTLVSKEKAFQLAGEDNDDKIYFITLGAVDVNGKPYDVPSVYDLLTSIEMEGKGVTPLHVHDLVRFYAEHETTEEANSSTREASAEHNTANETDSSRETKDTNVYKLVDFFIKHHLDSHIIIDEFPILKGQTTKGNTEKVNIHIFK